MSQARGGPAGEAVLFAFAGWSGPRPGLGRGLYATEPVFRAAVDACDRTARNAGVTVAARFAAAGAGPDGSAPAEAHQRMLVEHGVLQLALCDLWADAGVRPDAVLSHGWGEIAAAYCAGALTREEAVGVLCAVSRAVATHACGGELCTVTADLAEARDLCWNAPRPLDFVGTLTCDEAMVYSAAEDAAENAAYIEATGRLAERRPTAYAYHTMRSPYDLSVLEAELAYLSPRTPQMPVYSAIAGRDIATDGTFDALHWRWMVGHAHYFADATAAALRLRPRAIVILGTAPRVMAWIVTPARSLGVQATIVDSICPPDDMAACRGAPSAVSRPAQDEGGAEGIEDKGADAAFVNPVEVLTGFLERGAVHQVRDDVWLAVGHDEVREGFTRPAVFSSRIDRLEPLDALGLDGAEHTAARKALTRFFAPDALAELAEISAQVCVDLLSDRSGSPELDVVADLAAPLGEEIGARLIGLDAAQLARVRRAAGVPERDGRDVLASAATALADVRPRGKRSDLLLWLGATLNTKRAISTAVLLLLTDPALRRRVESRPAYIGALVDETVRLHPPEMMLARMTTQDTTLGGVAIPAGSRVMMCVAAANRDAAHFANPDRVDLDRRVTHLSYGVGVHRCIGARLARIEAEAALRALFAHMPGFRSAQPACTLRWIPSASTHGLERLLITA